MLKFLRSFFSLITDPLPRMSFFVFLGAFFLSCFIYKFLRRFECRFFEYHLDDEDDAYENFTGSASATLAEPNMIYVNPIPFANVVDSSAVSYSPYRNSINPEDSTNYPSNVQNGHHHN